MKKLEKLKLKDVTDYDQIPETEQMMMKGGIDPALWRLIVTIVSSWASDDDSSGSDGSTNTNVILGSNNTIINGSNTFNYSLNGADSVKVTQPDGTTYTFYGDSLTYSSGSN